MIAHVLQNLPDAADMVGVRVRRRDVVEMRNAGIGEKGFEPVFAHAVQGAGSAVYENLALGKIKEYTVPLPDIKKGENKIPLRTEDQCRDQKERRDGKTEEKPERKSFETNTRGGCQSSPGAKSADIRPASPESPETAFNDTDRKDDGKAEGEPEDEVRFSQKENAKEQRQGQEERVFTVGPAPDFQKIEKHGEKQNVKA